MKSKVRDNNFRRVRKIAKAIISFDISVRLSTWNNNLALSGRIFIIKFDTWVFFLNQLRKIKVSYKNIGYFTRIPIYEYILIVSRSDLLRMRNVSDKTCKENQNILSLCNNFFPKSAVYETYLVNSRSRNLLEKLKSSRLLKKFPAFYGTQKFITAFTSARHLSLLRQPQPMFFSQCEQPGFTPIRNNK